MVRRGTAGVVMLALVVCACTGRRQPVADSIIDLGDALHDGHAAPVDLVIQDLEHVSTIEFALGSVWAVTSSRPDVFSSGDLRTTVVRIDPATGSTRTVVETSGVEPTVAEAGGLLWVKTADEVVALDEFGDLVRSVPFRLRSAGDLAGDDTTLWATVNQEDRLVAIDTATGDVVHSVETGRFPAGPTLAFGRVWVPSLIDHTVTVVERRSDAALAVSTFPVAEDLKFAVPVSSRTHGDEVWMTNDDGELHAVSADVETFGQIRRVEVDRAINSLVVLDETALLLPTWGKRVVLFDLSSDAVLAEIDIDSIPFRALASHGRFWVSGDGSRELLTVIDPATLDVVARFEAGGNESNTTGPRQPIAVDDEVWVPNRGASSVFVVAAPPS